MPKYASDSSTMKATKFCCVSHQSYISVHIGICVGEKQQNVHTTNNEVLLITASAKMCVEWYIEIASKQKNTI